MGSLTPFADIAKAAFRVGVQPALFVAKRRARYHAAGIGSVAELPVCPIDFRAGSPNCDGDCAYTQRLCLAHLSAYRTLEGAWRLKPWLGTASVIPLADFIDYPSYEAAVGVRTGDAVRRSSKKARRQGYVTGFFHPPYLRRQMNEILGSKRFRSGGLVPYGLLGVQSGPPDHGHVAGYRPQPPCALHWTLTWGVFSTRDASGLEMQHAAWTLVGFVKLRRSGSLVHALQIMGHGDHLHAGINDLMHMDLVRWLLEDQDGACGGITHYMYGALEHAGNGLAAWKLRRGFRPMLLKRDAATAHR